MNRKTVLYAAVAGLAGVIVATAPVTWRIEEVAVAQPAHHAIAEAAPEAKVTPLSSKDLKEFPGKEGVTITVEYPPRIAGIDGKVCHENRSYWRQWTDRIEASQETR